LASFIDILPEIELDLDFRINFAGQTGTDIIEQTSERLRQDTEESELVQQT
jgi:hypothetical protein